MYLAIPSQPDCASAWREAVREVDLQNRHSAYNVIIDVADPIIDTTRLDPRIAVVEDFLVGYGKSVEAVANTIFPTGLYSRYGAPAFFDVFTGKVLPKVRKSERWSGYYFERMTQLPSAGGGSTNQLWGIVERLRDDHVKALNKFEMSLFDPERDVDGSPYGGQCLSFLSFKIVRTHTKTLALTAMYRNHYYIEKLLGNLVGLGRLMSFIARETGLEVGPLTVVSTHAEIDHAGKCSRSDIAALLSRFDQAGTAHRAA
jgi:hypothetical protein